MHIHRAALAVKGIAPDLLQQLVPGEDPAAGPEQHAEQLKFLQRQRNVLAVCLDETGLRTDPQAVDPIFLRSAALPGPPQQGLDPGQQLHHPEGLGQIIVRPQLQPQHLVIFAAPGREHDHRRQGGLPGGAEPFQDGKPVFLRQHDVQQHQLRRLPGEGAPKGGGRVEAFRVEAGAVQRVDHKLPDAAFVFQQIDHGGTSFNLQCTLSILYGTGGSCKKESAQEEEKCA